MPDPLFPASDSDLRTHVQRVLSESYELDREIGRGGMGIVYLARDRRLKRSVAIKLLPPELAFRPEIRSRFLKEAETAAQLSHANIVPIYSVDEREGLVFFVMAFIDGENLAVRLHREGAMRHDEVRRILIDVTRALAYAHDRGVVHRDIKPDNILIDTDGRVMVTDFGIARAITDGADARLTATGMAIGTPAYMSPEQSMGERTVDGRSDLYSLGIVAYQMLTGDLPFNASSTPALLVKHLSEAPPPILERCPTLAPDLATAVMLLLEKEPANRFASASELIASLESRQLPAGRKLTVPGTPARPAAPMSAPVSATIGDISYALGVTEDDIARWNDPQVVRFRRRAAPWAFFGVAAIIFTVFGATDDLMGIWSLWSIYIAWKYAKLWTDGFDWRDVVREPRGRMLFDVVAEWAESIKALWDPTKREQVRERHRVKAQQSAIHASMPRSMPRGSAAMVRPAPSSGLGAYATVVQEAARHREDIVRILQTLPKRDQQLVADVPNSAEALYQKIEALALSISGMERNLPEGSATAVDTEIARLESEANPLDTRGSEERVRRLAQLKRQRRAFGDVGPRAAAQKEKLESCALALQNMRLDVVRLKAGSQTFDHITSVAEKAVALAREVDTAMYVKDEMSKLAGRSVGSARRT